MLSGGVIPGQETQPHTGRRAVDEALLADVESDMRDWSTGLSRERQDVTGLKLSDFPGYQLPRLGLVNTSPWQWDPGLLVCVLDETGAIESIFRAPTPDIWSAHDTHGRRHGISRCGR